MTLFQGWLRTSGEEGRAYAVDVTVNRVASESDDPQDTECLSRA